MANTVSAVIAIRKDRQNDYATLAIDVNGSLAQYYNGTQAVPDWSTTGGPTLTPKIVSGKNNVTINKVTWTYNGTDVTQLGNKFEVNSTDHSLKIKTNLASADNQDPDTFTCLVEVTIDNVKYQMQRSVSAVILPMSQNGYAAILTATTTALGGGTESTTITLKVYDGNGKDATGSMKKIRWFKGDTELTANANKTTLVVNRSDVSWEQLYRVQVFEKASDKDPKTVAAIVITDQADTYMLAYTVDKSVSETENGQVTIQLKEFKDGAWGNLAVKAAYTANLYDLQDTDQGEVANGNTLEDGSAIIVITPGMMDKMDNANMSVVCSWGS